MNPHDPRLIYPELTEKEAHDAWPCAGHFKDGTRCDTRRDEHADQRGGSFPELDITDHIFVACS